RRDRRRRHARRTWDRRFPQQGPSTTPLRESGSLPQGASPPHRPRDAPYPSPLGPPADQQDREVTPLPRDSQRGRSHGCDPHHPARDARTTWKCRSLNSSPKAKKESVSRAEREDEPQIDADDADRRLSRTASTV